PIYRKSSDFATGTPRKSPRGCLTSLGQRFTMLRIRPKSTCRALIAVAAFPRRRPVRRHHCEEPMTEAEWLVCTNPDVMLEHLDGKATERKLRLFGCACCRRVWDLLPDERSRAAIEVSERFADGQVSKEELASAHKLAVATIWELTDMARDSA